MSDDGWEDVAYGPPAAGGSSADDGWEDVAIGPPAAPKSQGYGLGILREAAQGLTFGGADEAVAKLSDYFHRNKFDTGINVIQRALGYEPTYQLASEDDRLAQERQQLQAFKKEAPGTAAAANIAGSLALPIPGMGAAKGVVGALGKGAALGAGFTAATGFGTGEGGFENRLSNAQNGLGWGAGLGAGLGAASKLLPAVGGWLGGKADAGEKALLGVGKAEEKAAMRKGVDWAGDGSFTTSLDKNLALVKKDGARIFNNPAKTAEKFDSRVDELTKYTDAIENEATKLIQQKAAASGIKPKFKPDFTEARAYADSFAGTPAAQKLHATIDEAEAAFKSTPQTLSDLVQAKRAWGKVNKRIWSGTDAANNVDPTLTRKIYSGFRQSIEDNIDAVAGSGSPMVGKLKEANKMISAYLNFDKPLIDAVASKKYGFMNAAGRLLDFKTLASGGLIPMGVPAPLVIAANGARFASRAMPAQIVGAERGLASVANSAGRIAPSLIKPTGIMAGRAKEAPMTESTKAAPIAAPTAAKETDHPPLIKAIIKAESGGKANAQSPVGAKGMMQLMDATGKELARKYLPAGEKYDPFNREQNIKLGTAYIGELIKKYGDENLALAAYNWGMGNLDKLIARKKTTDIAQLLPSMPKETQNYVTKINKYLA